MPHAPHSVLLGRLPFTAGLPDFRGTHGSWTAPSCPGLSCDPQSVSHMAGTPPCPVTEVPMSCPRASPAVTSKGVGNSFGPRPGGSMVRGPLLYPLFTGPGFNMNSENKTAWIERGNTHPVLNVYFAGVTRTGTGGAGPLDWLFPPGSKAALGTSARVPLTVGWGSPRLALQWSPGRTPSTHRSPWQPNPNALSSGWTARTGGRAPSITRRRPRSSARSVLGRQRAMALHNKGRAAELMSVSHSLAGSVHTARSTKREEENSSPCPGG